MLLNALSPVEKGLLAALEECYVKPEARFLFYFIVLITLKIWFGIIFEEIVTNQE
jgi:hypothetical protein